MILYTNYQKYDVYRLREPSEDPKIQVGVKVGKKYILLIKAIVIIYLAIIQIDFNI